MQCNRCRREAVIHQPYSGLHLCGQHFFADLEAKAKRAIRTHHWLTSGDHIAVALSGSNGSSALLFFLKNLTARRRDITLSSITIDEGIAGYRDPGHAAAIAAALGVPCVTASFAEEFGTTVDALMREKGGACACRYCGVLKRTLLNKIALKHGISRLALGSSLDHEAESVLTVMLSGEVDGLLCRERVPEGAVPVIRPFMYVPEEEVALYSELTIGRNSTVACPVPKDSLQADAGVFLDEYVLGHPSARYSLVGLRERISAAGSAVQDRVPVCGRCGGPCGDACQSCRILDEVTSHAQ
jgi:uncharacterized protein (TIGR00269 family)